MPDDILKSGDYVEYDGKEWEIISIYDDAVWLRSADDHKYDGGYVIAAIWDMERVVVSMTEHALDGVYHVDCEQCDRDQDTLRTVCAECALPLAECACWS